MSDRQQLVCGACGQINRLPAERSPGDARCGGCHAPLFGGHPIEVDEQAFGRHVAHSDIPLLIDVWAPWCGPCRTMAPMFERAARELEPKVRLLKLNADTAPEVSARLGITGIPTLLLMRHGREVSRNSGAMDTQRIVAWTMAGLTRSNARSMS
ncbi:MAG TPA: thioredoxin TrxC [Bradyrhizobium sp.]|nr:thioredoxin TrxC [Bradyrhizobium sp.]